MSKKNQTEKETVARKKRIAKETADRREGSEDENPAESTGANAKGGVNIAVEIPYLCFFNMLIRASATGESVSEKVTGIMSGSVPWEVLFKEIVSNDFSEKDVLVSFPRDASSEDISIAVMMLSASNSYSRISKDLILTPTKVYAPLDLVRLAWDTNIDEGKFKFDPLSSLKKDDFISTMRALAKENMVVNISEDLAYVHGNLSKDTWNMIGGLIAVPVTTTMFGAEYETSSKIFGSVTLIGNGINALTMLISNNINSPIAHIREDMETLSKSFTKEEAPTSPDEQTDPA